MQTFRVTESRCLPPGTPLTGVLAVDPCVLDGPPRLFHVKRHILTLNAAQPDLVIPMAGHAVWAQEGIDADAWVEVAMEQAAAPGNDPFVFRRGHAVVASFDSLRVRWDAQPLRGAEAPWLYLYTMRFAEAL